MDTTNTQFHAYQCKPVLSFLDSPSNGLLIADEVGLGKTSEAGLIWTELRARYDARRLLVVCPAMLRQKWKDELASKFSIDASIVDAGELLEELRKGKAGVADGKALIRSEEHTSELQSLMRSSYAVFCLKKKTTRETNNGNK